MVRAHHIALVASVANARVFQRDVLSKLLSPLNLLVASLAQPVVLDLPNLGSLLAVFVMAERERVLVRGRATLGVARTKRPTQPTTSSRRCLHGKKRVGGRGEGLVG